MWKRPLGGAHRRLAGLILTDPTAATEAARRSSALVDRASGAGATLLGCRYKLAPAIDVQRKRVGHEQDAGPFDGSTSSPVPSPSLRPFGVGSRMDKPSRVAFRRAFDRPATATMHRLFADAASNDEVHSEAAEGLTILVRGPAITVFGSWGDYLRFRRQWRQRLPRLTEVSVPRGLHFPMNDNPGLCADAITQWHEAAP